MMCCGAGRRRGEEDGESAWLTQLLNQGEELELSALADRACGRLMDWDESRRMNVPSFLSGFRRTLQLHATSSWVCPPTSALDPIRVHRGSELSSLALVPVMAAALARVGVDPEYAGRLVTGWTGVRGLEFLQEPSDLGDFDKVLRSQRFGRFADLILRAAQSATGTPVRSVNLQVLNEEGAVAWILQSVPLSDWTVEELSRFVRALSVVAVCTVNRGLQVNCISREHDTAVATACTSLHEDPLTSPVVIERIDRCGACACAADWQQYLAWPERTDGRSTGLLPELFSKFARAVAATEAAQAPTQDKAAALWKDFVSSEAPKLGTVWTDLQGRRVRRMKLLLRRLREVMPDIASVNARTLLCGLQTMDESIFAGADPLRCVKALREVLYTHKSTSRQLEGCEWLNELAEAADAAAVDTVTRLAVWEVALRAAARQRAASRLREVLGCAAAQVLDCADQSDVAQLCSDRLKRAAQEKTTADVVRTVGTLRAELTGACVRCSDLVLLERELESAAKSALDEDMERHREAAQMCVGVDRFMCHDEVTFSLDGEIFSLPRSAVPPESFFSQCTGGHFGATRDESGAFVIESGVISVDDLQRVIVWLCGDGLPATLTADGWNALLAAGRFLSLDGLVSVLERGYVYYSKVAETKRLLDSGDPLHQVKLDDDGQPLSDQRSDREVVVDSMCELMTALAR